MADASLESVAPGGAELEAVQAAEQPAALARPRRQLARQPCYRGDDEEGTRVSDAGASGEESVSEEVESDMESFCVEPQPKGKKRKATKKATKRKLTERELREVEKLPGGASLAQVYRDAREAVRVRKHTAKRAAGTVEQHRVWKLGQLEKRSSKAARQTFVQEWPEMTEAQAVAFSLDRPNLAAERQKLLKLSAVVCEAVLDAGAPHLVFEEGWMAKFTATCVACGSIGPARWRPKSEIGRAAIPEACVDTTCLADKGFTYGPVSEMALDVCVNSAGVSINRALFARWRQLDGDERTGGGAY